MLQNPADHIIAFSTFCFLRRQSAGSQTGEGLRDLQVTLNLELMRPRTYEQILCFLKSIKGPAQRLTAYPHCWVRLTVVKIVAVKGKSFLELAYQGRTGSSLQQTGCPLEMVPCGELDWDPHR